MGRGKVPVRRRGTLLSSKQCETKANMVSLHCVRRPSRAFFLPLNRATDKKEGERSDIYVVHGGGSSAATAFAAETVSQLYYPFPSMSVSAFLGFFPPLCSIIFVHVFVASLLLLRPFIFPFFFPSSLVLTHFSLAQFSSLALLLFSVFPSRSCSLFLASRARAHVCVCVCVWRSEENDSSRVFFFPVAASLRAVSLVSRLFCLCFPRV